jgi:hypothetical protein
VDQPAASAKETAAIGRALARKANFAVASFILGTSLNLLFVRLTKPLRPKLRIKVSLYVLEATSLPRSKS